MIDDGWDRPGFASTKKEAGPAPLPTYTPFFVKSQQYLFNPKNDEDRESKVKGTGFRKTFLYCRFIWRHPPLPSERRMTRGEVRKVL
jgi:hypothetical protein